MHLYENCIIVFINVHTCALTDVVVTIVPD